MISFVAYVPTASGARAVRIVHEKGRQVVRIEHVGSVHGVAELAVLMEVARQRRHEGQGVLGLAPGSGTPTGSFARIVCALSQLVRDVVVGADGPVGFDAVDDEALRKLVLARMVESTSKADTIGVLAEIGVPAPSVRTSFGSLRRTVDGDDRDPLTEACLAQFARVAGRASMVLYDVTTLSFETEVDDELRTVGISKERRVDPQIQVGLLVDDRLPPRGALLRRQQGRDPHSDPHAAGVPGAPRASRHGGDRRCRHAVSVEPARVGGRRVLVHRRVADHQGT